MSIESPKPDQPRSPESQKDIWEVYREKLTEGRVATMIKIVLSDPNTRTIFYQLFEDRKILESGGVNMEDLSHKATPLIVTMMRDQTLRGLLMEAMLGDMRDKSDALRLATREAADEAKEGKMNENTERALVFNRVVVGAGVHASIFNNALTRRDPNSKNLTTDKGNKISGNFSTKQFVSINTRNQPHTGDIPHFEAKRGNLNFFGKDAPVQLPYTEPELFPTADTIAEVATANQYLSNSKILFESQVDRILLPEDEQGSDKWPARYKILFSDGRFVFTDEVIVTTGLGQIEYPKQFDEETLKIVRRDSRVNEEGAPPGIMTYEEFAEFIVNSPTPLRHFAKKTVDVAGGGDGAATVLEELLRFGKRKSYKLDVAQIGTPSKIHWAGQKIKDSTQYKNLLANERYLMLAQDMPLSADELIKYQESTRKAIERKIDPKDGYLVQIRDSDDLSKGKYRVTYMNPEDKTVQESYTDFVVLAAGYRNKIGSLFGKDSNPFDREEEAEVVKGDIDGVPVPLAVKLKEHGIYAAGPASMSKVLKDAELELASLSGLSVNKGLQHVAIAVYGPRTERLAEILGKEPRQDLKSFEYENSPIEISRSENQPERYLVEARAGKTYQENMMSDIRVKIAVGEVFDKCKLLSPEIEDIDIIIQRNPQNKNSAFISFSPNIAQAEKIKDILISGGLSEDLVNLVSQSRWQTIIEVPFNKQGKIKTQDINLRREKY